MDDERSISDPQRAAQEAMAEVLEAGSARPLMDALDLLVQRLVDTPGLKEVLDGASDAELRALKAARQRTRRRPSGAPGETTT
jgi:hypothetical protein